MQKAESLTHSFLKTNEIIRTSQKKLYDMLF